MRPLIGITGNQLLEAAPAFSGISVAYTPIGFVKGVQAAGGNPLIIPIGAPETAADYIAKIDGLLLTGGQDVSPNFYGEEPTLHIGATFPLRDDFELALVAEALKQKKPILAVCRGMQLLNVQMGGSLYQDLAHEYPEMRIQHQQKTDFKYATHSVVVTEGSHLHALFGEKLAVNSFHHQALKVVAKGLTPVGYSPDGLVEAVEATDPEQSVLAIQWHPETMIPEAKNMGLFFEDLVARSSHEKG